MPEVLLINSNMVFPGDSNISGRPIPIRDVEKVVNLGLLSLASYLNAEGVSVQIMDLVGHPDDMEAIRNAIEQERPKFVGISCISCFTYPKLAEYSELIKTLDKSIFVMAGGQHVSGIPQTTLEEMPHVDCIVRGEGEYILSEIITRVKAGRSLADIPATAYRDRESGEIIDNTQTLGEKVNLNELPFLEYTLYPNFREYAPHVEVSRWCVFGCNFCTSSAMSKTIEYKSVPRFVDELEYVKAAYGRDDLRFFFACSTFGLKKSRIEELIDLMKKRNLNIAWRTETRADGPVVDYLEELVDVGLSAIDLGLESGSPTMLKLMNKCKDTQDYLSKTKVFMEKASKVENLLLKINLVFYAGESPETLKETITFLMENAAYIDTISAGPVMLYSGVPMARMLSKYAAEYGTTLVEDDFWDKVHAYPVNPSAHFSFDQMNGVALTLAKMLCPDREYFEVKKYGQFPLDMDFDDFKREISKQEEHHLPFSFDREAYFN